MVDILGIDLILFVGLVLLGVAILMLIKAVVHFLVPLVGAIVVWLYTGSLVSAGIAFVVIAFLELVLRKL